MKMFHCLFPVATNSAVPVGKGVYLKGRSVPFIKCSIYIAAPVVFICRVKTS